MVAILDRREEAPVALYTTLNVGVEIVSLKQSLDGYADTFSKNVSGSTVWHYARKTLKRVLSLPDRAAVENGKQYNNTLLTPWTDGGIFMPTIPLKLYQSHYTSRHRSA